MEIHLGLLPYPKENDTSEEVSLYFNTLLLIKVGKKICVFIYCTEQLNLKKYIILTLFYDQNYVNLSNLKFHPLCHTKSSFFFKITQIYYTIPHSCSYLHKSWTNGDTIDVILNTEFIYIQLNLSNPTHQGTRKICRIVQDVGIVRFYFS